MSRIVTPNVNFFDRQYLNFVHIHSRNQQITRFGTENDFFLGIKKIAMNPIIKNYFSVAKKYKAASLLNFLSLTLAFAVFIIIGMQVHYELTFNNCHKNYDQICRFTLGIGKERIAVSSPKEAETIAKKCPEIKEYTIISPWNMTLKATDTENELIKIEAVINYATEGIFSIFDYNIIEGSIDQFDDGLNIVVPQSFANKYYPQESAVGKTLRIDGHENKDIYTIIAVFEDHPENNCFKNNIIRCANEKELENAGFGNRSYHSYFLLNDGFKVEDLPASMRQNITYEDIPDVNSKEEMDQFWARAEYNFQPLKDWYYDDYLMYDTGDHGSKPRSRILIIVAFAIIIIAGINFNNLNTAMSMLRIKNINTMKVLGSTNLKIRLSMIFESIIEFIIAGLLGALIVQICHGSFINQFVTVDLSILNHWGIVLLALGIGILAGILSGLYPAMLTTSYSPALVLKGSFGLSPRGKNIKSVLLCFQMFCSFILLITAFFVYLQSQYLINAPLGFDKDVIILAHLSDKAAKQHNTAQNKLLSYSGIEAVCFADGNIGTDTNTGSWGLSEDNKDSMINLSLITTRPGLINTLGLKIIEGRCFNSSDSINNEEEGQKTIINAIINEKAHKLYNLNIDDVFAQIKIVGIIEDFHYETQHRPIGPLCIIPPRGFFHSRPCERAYIRIKKGIDTKAAIKYIHDALFELDPDSEPYIEFYDNSIQKAYSKEKNLSILFSLFGLAALFISLSGVFGMVVFDSENKRKEIGVRKVFGSTTKQILNLFAKYYLIVLCACFLAAIPITIFGLKRWLSEFPVHTTLDWYVFIGVFIMIAIVTMSIVLLQNFHAANENPIKSLRNE